MGHWRFPWSGNETSECVCVFYPPPSQVARVQLGILQTLASLPPSTDVSKAIEMLNAELMDITKLYGDFAEPFGLAECKLAIVHCAGHYDPTLVESLWRDIFDNGAFVHASVNASKML